jgi:hypothetical protein
MIQTDNVIETTIQPELESSELFQPTPTRQVKDDLDILIGDREEYVDAQSDKGDLKSGKVTKSPTRTTGKKKALYRRLDSPLSTRNRKNQTITS